VIDHIDNHVAQAEARLLEQFKGKPRVQAIIDSVAAGHQRVEDALYAVIQGRMLDTAIGQTLDNIGSLMGLPRGGIIDDEEYRAAIRGVIAEYFSNSTPDVIMAILQSLFEPISIFSHGALPGGNVAYGVCAPAIPSSLYPLMRRIFSRSLAAGIELAYLSVFDTPVFAMAGDQTWVGGFGSVSPPSINLLPPNIARGGDTLGNVAEWLPCTQGEPFGTTTGGGGTTVTIDSSASEGGPASYEGDKAVLIRCAAGGGTDKFGGKFTIGGLTELQTYTFSYEGYGYLGDAQVFIELAWSGGLFYPSSTTGAAWISQYAYSAFSGTFTLPAGCTTIEIRICEQTDSSFQWRMDALQLQVGSSATAWVDPTPTTGASGAPFADAI
jgi:hypothetical protein